MADDPDWAPKQDMSLLCRVCANQHDYLIPIFEGEGLDHDMPTKMEKHLPIKVRENDKLPTQMCYQCASTIIAWSDLHTNCLEADKKLTRMLRINEKKSASAAGLDDDGGSDHYEDAYDAGGGGDEDEDFEKEIKQLISDAGVELGSSSGSGTTKQKLNKPPSAKPAAARVSRKRKSEATTPVKRESKKSKSEAAAGSSSSGTVALLKPKEENVSGDDRFVCHQCLGTRRTGCNCDVNQGTLEQRSEMGDIKYECSLCEQTFSHKNYWRAHIRTHSQDRSHACDVCPSKFKARSDLGKHKKTVHSGTNRFPCKFCNASFKRASNLKLHTKVHLETETFTCAHCELLVTSKEFLEEHITHSHMQVVNTEDKAHKKRRKFSVPRGKLLSCNLCNEKCISYTGLTRHISQTHAEIKENQCSVCKKIYNKDTQLHHHLRVKHFDIETFTCEYCGKQMKTKKGLKNHINLLHLQIENYVCSTCGKVYFSLRQLKTHQYTHTGEKSCICEVCGKAFAYDALLSGHKIVHKEKKYLYECSTCKRKFFRNSQYRTHLKRHSDVKLYACNVCSFKSKTSCDLRKHKKFVHSDARPYQCDLCSATFKRPSHLKQHGKIHN